MHHKEHLCAFQDSFKSVEFSKVFLCNMGGGGTRVNLKYRSFKQNVAEGPLSVAEV